MSGLPLPAVIAVFALAALAVWLAGIKLSDTTDVLATRLGLGEALGGLILLAIATNLPEIAITVSAALANDLGIAIGNILGGIAIQTVVLALLDGFGLGRKDGLTYRSASLSLVLEATVVIAVLVIAVMGAQLPASDNAGGIEPAAVMIVATWLAGLWLVGRSRPGLPWHELGNPPGRTGTTARTRQEGARSPGATTDESARRGSGVRRRRAGHAGRRRRARAKR